MTSSGASRDAWGSQGTLFVHGPPTDVSCTFTRNRVAFCEVEMVGHAAELQAFLKSARARISPERLGFPTDRRRRVAGLRREEIAESIGVSAAWYARFESGRARLSVAALARVADVLRLAPAERARLFALARPEICADLGGNVYVDTTGVREVRVVQRLLRELYGATGLDDIVLSTVRALNDAVRPTNAAFCVRQYDDDGNAVFDFAEGPAAEGYIGLRQSAEAAAHERDAMLANHCVGLESLSASPSAEYRERIGKLDVRSYLSIGIGPIGRDTWTAIGFANAAPGAFAPIWIASLNTIGEAARSELYRLHASSRMR